ncbi:SDR family oxidoreductase [Streptomyces liangshanensis]|uniref:SDR family oxidoreductase n=1 Tax=Streptomyces liangshanensis TaxID=2717324 RepID=UPI0036D7EFF4
MVPFRNRIVHAHTSPHTSNLLRVSRNYILSRRCPRRGVGARSIAVRPASAGAELVLPVRNRRKGAAAVDRVRGAAPGAEASLADLARASLESVGAPGDRLPAQGRPIHMLVHDAAVMTPRTRHETRDGFELQFGTNFLGHFALTARVLPLLREGATRVTPMSALAARAPDPSGGTTSSTGARTRR